MATEYYTDDILTENFVSLSRFSGDVVDAMQSLTTLAERTEGRLKVLEELAKQPTVVKSSRLFLLAACALSAYAGYKYAEDKCKKTVAESISELEAELDEREARHQPKNNINGTTIPNHEN